MGNWEHMENREHMGNGELPQESIKPGCLSTLQSFFGFNVTENPEDTAEQINEEFKSGLLLLIKNLLGELNGLDGTALKDVIDGCNKYINENNLNVINHEYIKQRFSNLMISINGIKETNFDRVKLCIILTTFFNNIIELRERIRNKRYEIFNGRLGNKYRELRDKGFEKSMVSKSNFIKMLLDFDIDLTKFLIENIDCNDTIFDLNVANFKKLNIKDYGGFQNLIIKLHKRQNRLEKYRDLYEPLISKYCEKNGRMSLNDIVKFLRNTLQSKNGKKIFRDGKSVTIGNYKFKKWEDLNNEWIKLCNYKKSISRDEKDKVDLIDLMSSLSSDSLDHTTNDSLIFMDNPSNQTSETSENSKDESKEDIYENDLVGIFTVKIKYFLDEYGEKKCTLVDLCKEFYNNGNRSIEDINDFFKKLTNDINSNSEKDKDFPGIITTLFNGINSLNSIHFGDDNIDINISKALPHISNGIKELYESVIKFLLNNKYDEEFFKNGGNFKFGDISIDSRNKYRLMKFFLRKRRDNTPKNIPSLSEKFGFNTTVVALDLVRGIFSDRINLEIDSINNSFSTKLSKYKRNRYVVDFLNIIQTGKLSNIKEYIDSLINQIDNSEYKKDIINFYKIVNSIIENLENDNNYKSRMNAYTKKLEGEPLGNGMVGNRESRIYKCSMVYKISEYIKDLGNKINTDQNLKQGSLEIDIENIVNDFSNKLEVLKINSSIILNNLSKGPVFENPSNDVSRTGNNIGVNLISHIKNYIEEFSKLIPSLPEANNIKHKEFKKSLKSFAELFVNTYNQIVNKINSHFTTSSNVNEELKKNLQELHESVVYSTSEFFVSTQGFYGFNADFIDEKTGKFKEISLPNSFKILTSKIGNKIAVFVLGTFACALLSILIKDEDNNKGNK